MLVEYRRPPFPIEDSHETVDVEDAAVGLNAPPEARYALIRVGAEPIRWRDDGEDPTDSEGYPQAAGDFLELVSREQIAGFKAIRVGSNSTLSVSYYKESK